MGKKHINATEKLWALQHDIKRMLDNRNNPKEIKEFMQRELNKLKDTYNQVIDW